MTAVTRSGLTGVFLPPKKPRSGPVPGRGGVKKTRSGPVPGRGGGKKNPVRSGARWSPPVDRGDRTGTVPVGFLDFTKCQDGRQRRRRVELGLR